MEYSVIATLGPSSETEDIWSRLLSAGATSFRLNTSHLTISKFAGWMDRLTNFLSKAQSGVTVTLDLQGSKWRLGEFSTFPLLKGQPVEFIFGTQTSRTGVLPVPHQDFFRAAAESSGEIVLNDARILLKLEQTGPDWIKAKVILGGDISARKGITYSSSSYRNDTLSPKDQEILSTTRQLSYVRYAISYIKDAAEMKFYRTIVSDEVYLTAKLERGTAMDEALQISGFADDLWLCRGDLGAELGLAGMAETSYQLSARLSNMKKPVFLAGQVLEHMATHPTPTRSEVCQIYNALKDGYQGIVLSDETAVGGFPEASCRIASIFRK